MRRALQIIGSISEEGFELIVGLLVMLMVEHAYGPSGLGIFAYLLACLFTIRFFSTFGVARHIEVETARLRLNQDPTGLLTQGFTAILLTSTACSLLLLITAGFDASHTRIDEKTAAYIIMAVLLPISNLNSLKLAILNSQGEHGTVVRLRMIRHAFILVAVYFSIGNRIAPSFLLAAYLTADVILAYRLRRLIKGPKFFTAIKQFDLAIDTLKRGRPYLFTGSSLDMLLNIDLFVLGLFVSAYKLGIYTEAAILVRCCLIIAVGTRPFLRRRYTIIAEKHGPEVLSKTLALHSAFFFTLQGIMAILTLLYYPLVLNFFFDTRAETTASFEIFLLFVPGLLFFNTFSALEPVYEAIGRADSLQGLFLSVAAINICLAVCLIPLAGIQGAACATMITMLAHFFLFGYWLPFRLEPGKFTFLTAALAFYLIYLLLSSLNYHPFFYFWLAPMLLLSAYYGCGLFGIETQKSVS